MTDSQGGSLATQRTRRLLRGDITYSAAKERETNILHELKYWSQEKEFLNYLYRNRDTIRSIVSRHLGSTAENCHVTGPERWLCGSFNLCIRVDIDQDEGPQKQVIMRFPLPYRIGENVMLGNADEKILCEAGTYAWLQSNCPGIPIPRLYGLGLTTGRTYTALANLPFFQRMVENIRRRVLGWLGYPVPSQYMPCYSRFPALKTGYIVIEYIPPSRGQMLSETWQEGRHDAQRRMNLFRGLSRALVQLAQIPLPRIGSFVLDEKGYLKLENRPLTDQIHILENEHIPVDIPRHITYDSADSYIHGILSFHESRLRYQPNAVQHLEDGAYQTSGLMVMRSVWSCFFDRKFHRGPFFLTLTDIHQSNVFVDDEWNITCFIDLEWACSRPIEMIHPPYWLTNQAIDMISAPEYELLHAEFMKALAEEESAMPSLVLYPALQRGWESGTFWFALALDSPTALFQIFYEHIRPRFSNDQGKDFWIITFPYWSFDAFRFIERRVKDKEQYDVALREAFMC